jgi:hypothetical protein
MSLSAVAPGRSRLRGFALLLAASVPLSGVAEEKVRADAERIRRLMERSGLWSQIAQIEPQSLEGLARMRRGAKDSLGAREAEALEAAIREAFAADRLRARMTEELASTLDVATIDAALAWLETDLGRRITGLEEQATSVTGGDHGEHLGPKLLAAAGEPRRALFHRLARATRAGEVAYAIGSTVADGMFRGLALAAPQLGLDPGLVARQMAAERDAMIAEGEAEAQAAFAYTYRELSDEELARYVEFSESAAGRRYGDATARSLERALAEAARRMGERMARDLAALSPAAPR